MVCVCAVLLTSCGNKDGNTSSGQTETTRSSTQQEQKSESDKKDETKEDISAPEASDTNSKAEDITEGTKNNTLVVYFSRTGNTEKIAKHLTELTGADEYVIEAAVPYTDEDIEYNNDSCRANQEQNDKTVRPEISNPIASIDSYDTIFLGYPIWWGQEPRIIDTFLESYDFSDKTVIPFCTSGSSGIGRSGPNMEELAGSGTWLDGQRFSGGVSEEELQSWIEGMK